MDRRKRYFGRCADFVQDSRLIAVNPGDLITNLILFETFIIHSFRLLEFPQLISIFGFESVIELLRSRSLKIHCTSNSLGTLGTTEELFKKGKGYTFDFVEVIAADPKDYVHGCFEGLRRKTSLSEKQFIKLKENIANRFDSNASLPYGPDCPEAKAFRSLMEDLTSNVPNVKRAVALELKRRLGAEVAPADFSLRLHQIGESAVQADTNIAANFRVADDYAHNAINSALMRLVGISRTFAEMERHTALCGLNDQDFPLFAGKFEFLALEFSSDSQASQLRRVMEIRGFPNFEPLIQEGSLRLEKILEMRKSKECQQFRDWLRGLDSVTDEEIRHQIESIRTTFGNFLARAPGKGLRWFVSSVIGLLSVVGGPVVSALDTFIVQKLFPSSGPISFLNNSLPSAFEEGLNPNTGEGLSQSASQLRPR